MHLRSTLMFVPASFCGLALLVASFSFAAASHVPQEHLLITAPPVSQATQCAHPHPLKRDSSCQYGTCGTACLSQGAFCCGPAGTLATSPFWVCDNGACITSVRGTTGIVDCYDPDNPSGTTQSCIDQGATTTCNPTDRCYTCTGDQPFCQWQTYIDPNSPTLRWFSCIDTKLADLTFNANTITGNLPSRTASSNSTGNAGKSSPLSTGAIIGIAVGGGIAVVGSVATIAFFCLKRRKAHPPPPQELDPNAMVPQMAEPDRPPMELDANEYTRSELGGSVTAYSPSTPFTPSEGYARNVEEVDMWRRGTPASRTDQQAKDWYFGQAQPPRELHEGRRE